MLLRAFMLILSETVCLSASLASVTVCRLGRNTRFVLLFAWLTRCPLRTPFPVNSQRRDMAALSIGLLERAALLRKGPLARQAPRRLARICADKSVKFPPQAPLCS